MKTIGMSLWEEVLGPVLNVQMNEGYVLAQIGKISVMLPPEMEKKLRSFIGIRIAVLRTDIAGKGYLIRVLPAEKHEMESAAIAVQAPATEMNTRQRKLERVL